MKISIHNIAVIYKAGIYEHVYDADSYDVSSSCDFVFEYDETTTVGNLVKKTREESKVYAGIDCNITSGYSIVDGPNALIRIENQDLSLIDVINRFGITGAITSYTEICLGRGEVLHQEALSKGLKFTIHYRETYEHLTPHVHVRDMNSDSDSLFSIESGLPIEGFENIFRTKVNKKVKKIITNNNELLRQEWNKVINGIVVEIMPSM